MFEWDDSKRTKNLLKHGVDFDHAVEIFEGLTWERIDNRRDYGEERIVALGHSYGDIIVVTYTWRNGARRIISAWAGGRKEHEQYYKNIAGGNPGEA